MSSYYTVYLQTTVLPFFQPLCDRQQQLEGLPCVATQRKTIPVQSLLAKVLSPVRVRIVVSRGIAVEVAYTKYCMFSVI